MTIAEAVCLILHAAALGTGGETFVFDMGKPINIYEIARTFSLFSGLNPGKDVPIEFVGLKEGEKVAEELWEPWENAQPTQHSRILALCSAEISSTGIVKQIDELEELLARGDHGRVLAYLHRFSPQFAATRHKSDLASASSKVVPIRPDKQLVVAISSEPEFAAPSFRLDEMGEATA
jgi:FlaA1/EpsC-like NDP-sugar epimerase